MHKNILISFLQTFGILLVVLGHSFTCYPGLEQPLLTVWIYSFHMPLFVFISGFLLRYGLNSAHHSLSDISLSGKDGFLWKKVKRLLIPYVFVSTLAFFPKAIFNQYAMRPVDITFVYYLKQLLYPWDNVIVFFWFLPTLFFIFIVVVYGGRLLKAFDAWYWDVVLLFILCGLHIVNPLGNVGFLNLAGVMDYIFYFYFGYVCCKYHFIERWKYGLMSVIVSILLSVLFVTGVPDFPGKDVLTAINGIYLSIGLGYIYIRWHCTYLHHLFGASMAIYLFSWFPQTASQQVLVGAMHVPWQIGSLLAIITGVYLPWLIYKWIVKHKSSRVGSLIAFLTGQ